MPEPAAREERTVDADAVRQLGAAVLTAQMFETLFVLVARSALKCPDAKDFDEIAPFERQAFKQPISALVKELGRANQIDPGLADRVFTWVENRHTLVHRHFLENAETPQDEYWSSMKDLSKRVFAESAELCGVFVDLFVTYAAKMPQAQAMLRDNASSFETFSSFAKQARNELKVTPSHG
jgi:hypothetical protein